MRTEGVGCDVEPPWCPTTLKRLKGMIAQVRRTRGTPVATHAGHPCLVRKGLSQGKATKPRMVHVACSFWSGWYKQLKASGRRWEAPPHHHGFIKGRRRETAMLAQMNATWRLRKAGLSRITDHKDATNAFASTLHT